MLLFYPPKKNTSTFTPIPPPFSGDIGLLGQGLDLIDKGKKTLNQYGSNTTTRTFPMGKFRAGDGSFSYTTINPGPNSTILSSNPPSSNPPNRSSSRISVSPSSERPRGTYFGDPVTQQKQFNLDTYAKAAPGVLFGQGDPGFETPAMRVARQNSGDLSGPGGPLPILGQGNPRFGETGVGNVFAEGDPRLTQSSPSTSSLSMMGEYPMPSGLNY